jgi:hypothetical protein
MIELLCGGGLVVLFLIGYGCCVAAGWADERLGLK